MEREAFHLLSDMEKSWWYRGRAATIHAALRHCGIHEVADVLDYGAGFGGMHDELAKIATRVSAYEPDAEAAESAGKRGYAHVFSPENEALSRQYDMIGLFDVVEHIKNDREFLRKAYEALSVGGRLAITVPAFQFLGLKKETGCWI